jgi:hypothetical protein
MTDSMYETASRWDTISDDTRWVTDEGCEPKAVRAWLRRGAVTSDEHDDDEPNLDDPLVATLHRLSSGWMRGFRAVRCL